MEKDNIAKEIELPSSWEDFCDKNPVIDYEYYINDYSYPEELYPNPDKYAERDYWRDRNLCKSKEIANAFVAFIQLKRIWDEYIKDLEFGDTVFSIVPSRPFNKPKEYTHFIVDGTESYFVMTPLYFPNGELAEEFLAKYSDLFEKLKPLYL